MKPIKRHNALKSISREHHQGLLLSWKIRAGLKKEIELERIKKYCDFFYQEELIAHFNVEEEYIFTVLPKGDEMVKRALAEHRRLKRLFNKTEVDLKTLNTIEEELEQHIRFEERVLFNKIQEVATPHQLQKIEEVHHPNEDSQLEKWADKFWE